MKQISGKSFLTEQIIRGVEIEGLQFYSGTQKKDLSQMKTELEHLDEFIGELKSESGFEAQVLEYGPGFFCPIF